LPSIMMTAKKTDLMVKKQQFLVKICQSKG